MQNWYIEKMIFKRHNRGRRQFVTTLLIGGLTAFSGELIAGSPDARQKLIGSDEADGTPAGKTPDRKVSEIEIPGTVIPDSAIRDAVRKAENFEHDFKDDIHVNDRESRLLSSVLKRMTRLQRTVGYGNFNLIDLDSARRFAKRYSGIGAFTKQEIVLIEALFEFDASRYGFFGRKVSTTLTEEIQRKDVKKIRGSGHYLYQGDALALYRKIKKQLGDDLILTSGIRSVVKQLYLFIAKAHKSGGNLSRAARSLAPPGHSFHGIGDFDIGQRGLGAANFTNAFAHTPLHEHLTELGYIAMRYPMANPYGVRHEPWHIKVVADV